MSTLEVKDGPLSQVVDHAWSLDRFECRMSIQQNNSPENLAGHFEYHFVIHKRNRKPKTTMAFQINRFSHNSARVTEACLSPKLKQTTQ